MLHLLDTCHPLAFSRLLELPLLPCRLDHLLGDRPDLTRSRGTSRDGACDHVDNRTELGLLLVEVTDLVDLDLDNGHAWVVGFPGVDAVAFVAEPSANSWVVKLLNKLVILLAAENGHRVSQSRIRRA